MRSTGSCCSEVAAASPGSDRVMRAASATRRHTAKVVSALPLRWGPRPERTMDASSVRSAWVRAARPASIPAAVRSSCARPSCSIQPSRAYSSRYCWSTMPCHIAGSTRRVPIASVSYTAPYCTLPGVIRIHRMSSSAPSPCPGVALASSGAW